MVIVTRTGERRVVILNVGAVKDKDGTILHSTSVQTDITERKLAEQEFVQQRNELAHVARVSTMGQLASSLAHELNQPLGAIMRNAEAGELFLQDRYPTSMSCARSWPISARTINAPAPSSIACAA